MDKHEIKRVLKQYFPFLKNGELLDIISSKGSYLCVPGNQQILEVGSFIKVIPLVIKGSIKVMREGRAGRFLLYYIEPGESCAMTLSSCTKKEKSKVNAIAQHDTELIALPVEEVYSLQHKFREWQDFVIETFNHRFGEIISVLDDVVFHKMDERLSNYLSMRSKRISSSEILTSHREIACDLATSREVISRLLKQFEKSGLVKLSRGKVKLLSEQSKCIT